MMGEEYGRLIFMNVHTGIRIVHGLNDVEVFRRCWISSMCPFAIASKKTISSLGSVMVTQTEQEKEEENRLQD
jgi:hypothetical protein